MKQKFIYYFMDLAERTAKLSNAERLKVGAVLVKGTRPIMTGYNGTPDGYYTNACEDYINGKSITKPEVLHAEANIIARMARSNESTEGCELFITHNCCFDCAKLLVQAGIRKVWYLNSYRPHEIYSQKAFELFAQQGVEVEKVDFVNDDYYTKSLK
jgi:dCMP deaminase